MIKKLVKLKQIIRNRGFAATVYIAIKEIKYRIREKKRNLHLYYLRLRSKNGLLLRNIQGSKMYLDVNDPGLSKSLLFKGIHEDLVTDIMREEVEEGMTIIDIGANLGYYALLEASIVGEGGMVYALEPVPKNFNILCKNISINGYKNIKAYCKAVSSKSGPSKISLTDASNWACMLDMKDPAVSEYMKQKMSERSQDIISVEAVNLDEFLKKEGVKKINMIRMDIEGYEIDAINGMTNTLKNAPPPIKLVLEIHNKIFSNPETVIGSMLNQLLLFKFSPKYVIFRKEIIKDINEENFVEIACSAKNLCPHVILEK